MPHQYCILFHFSCLCFILILQCPISCPLSTKFPPVFRKLTDFSFWNRHLSFPVLFLSITTFMKKHLHPYWDSFLTTYWWQSVCLPLSILFFPCSSLEATGFQCLNPQQKCHPKEWFLLYQFSPLTFQFEHSNIALFPHISAEVCPS